MGDDVVPLGAKHVRSEFDCGEPSLNNWLQRNATKAGKGDTARTYVLVDGVRVVGYYAVAAHSVAPDVLGPSSSKHDVGGVLLARLAVDRSCQSRGLGSLLLIDALRRAVTVADQIGAEMIFVDALNEAAAAYYEAKGFHRFAPDRLQLYLPMKHVRATLQAADSSA